MGDQYRLVNKVPVPESDMKIWGEALNADRKVAYNEIGDKRVSTVFLGLDHSFGDGPPLLFETMVFPMDSYSDQYCERYSTYEEAEAGHQRVVKALREGTLELYGE